MLIGLLMAAIIAILSGGESEYLPSIPKIKKEIKRNVVEESRKDSLLVIVKGYEKEVKKSEKAIKKTNKKVYKAAINREVGTPEFLDVYDAYFTTSVNLISSLVDYRLLFQEQITEEELSLITEKALEEPKKKENRKEQKGEEKIEDQIKKKFKKINEIVIKDIEDPDKAKLLTSSLSEFESTIYAYLEEAKEIGKKKRLLLSDKNISRQELDDIFEKSNQIRIQASRIYAQFREDAIQNTTAKEWKSLQKDMKLFIKK
jgi:hypothetical protein